MKRVVCAVVLALAASASGCAVNPPEPPTPATTTRAPSVNEKARFAAVDINGHRYVFYNYYDNCALMHAASCACHGESAKGGVVDSVHEVSLRAPTSHEKQRFSSVVIEGHRYIFYNYHDNCALVHDQSCPCLNK